MFRRILAALVAFTLVLPTALPAKTKLDQSFSFPKDKPIKIVLFRPDLEVASLGAGGIPSPNPDWTANARKYTLDSFQQSIGKRQFELTQMPDLQGDDVAYAAEYQSLYRAVANAVMTHNYLLKLPSKKLPNGKYKFDWTLGPGAKHLGELAGGNYGLFVFGYDAYATAGRKAMQIFVLLATSAIGAGVLPQGGLHFSYASLVDLDTGNIVWFNFYGNKKGDIRTPEGAQSRADTLLSTLPLRDGEKPVKKN